MPHVSRAELETIITRAADEQDWRVFSEDPRIIRRMTRAHGEGSKVGALGREWVVPKGCVSLRKSLAMTSAQKSRLASVARKARKARESLASSEG